MKPLRAALLAACLATSAQAATVSVDNTVYDVTTLTGRFDENVALLQGQVWWGNTTLASTFAALLSTLLGTPNNPSTGPLFATSIAKNKVNGQAFALRLNRGGVATTQVNANSKGVTYAVARVIPPLPAAVPAPAAGLLLLSALGGIAALRYRRRARA